MKKNKSLLMVGLIGLIISTHSFAVQFIDDEMVPSDNHMDLEVNPISPKSMSTENANKALNIFTKNIYGKSLSFESSEQDNAPSFFEKLLNAFKGKSEPSENLNAVNDCFTSVQKNMAIYNHPDKAKFYYDEVEPGVYKPLEFPKDDLSKLQKIFSSSEKSIVGFNRSSNSAEVLFPLLINLKKEKFSYNIFYGKQMFNYRKTDRGYRPVIIGYGVLIRGDGKSKDNSLSLNGFTGISNFSAAISSKKATGNFEVEKRGLSLPSAVLEITPLPKTFDEKDLANKMNEIEKYVKGGVLSQKLNNEEQKGFVIEPYYIAVGNKDIPENCWLFQKYAS